MKIIILSSLYETKLGGGAAHVVQSLVKELVTHGHEIIVVTSSMDHCIQFEVVDGIKVIRFFPVNLYWVYDKDRQPAWKRVVWQLFDIWNPFTFSTLKTIFAQEAPDVVHTHKIRGFSLAPWSAAAALKVDRLIHTSHDFEIMSPQGTLEGRVGQMVQENHILLQPYLAIRRRLAQKVHTFTTPSQYLMDLHLQKDFFSRARHRVIPNTHGLDSLEILPEDIPLQPQGKRNLKILYLGRIILAKGVALLCEAVKRLAETYTGISLNIVGWGLDLDDLRSQYGHVYQIHFLEGVEGEKKWDIIRSCDILALPSKLPESFGIVVTEAYCCGKPVIVSRMGGLTEIVQDGITGFLVTPGSLDEIAAALEKFILSPDMYNQMSADCLEYSKQFSRERFCANYLDAYQK